MATTITGQAESRATLISTPATPIVKKEDLSRLPAAVQRYLTYTGIIGTPWIETVCVKYSGRFRMAVGKPWMALNVTQYYTTNPPSFLWKASFKMAGLPFMFATDVFKNGHGHMLGKLLGLFTVVDGQGEEVDQGTMVRYLQEMTWFPTAYLGKNVIWRAVSDHAADVTFEDNGKRVTGRMYFDDMGRILTFIAQRTGEHQGRYSMNPWTTPTTEYGVFAGLNLPAGGLGVWRLPSGDFTYIDVRVKEVRYNQPIEAF
jgi:hypothetical protein